MLQHGSHLISVLLTTSNTLCLPVALVAGKALLAAVVELVVIGHRCLGSIQVVAHLLNQQ